MLATKKDYKEPESPSQPTPTHIRKVYLWCSNPNAVPIRRANSFAILMIYIIRLYAAQGLAKERVNLRRKERNLPNFLQAVVRFRLQTLDTSL